MRGGGHVEKTAGLMGKYSNSESLAETIGYQLEDTIISTMESFVYESFVMKDEHWKKYILSWFFWI